MCSDIPDSEETAAPLVAKDEVTITLEGLEAPTTEAMAPETTEVVSVETVAEKPTTETEEVSHEFVITETAEVVSREVTLEETPLPESEQAASERAAAESFQTLITEIEEAFAEDHAEEVPIVEEEGELPRPTVAGIPVQEEEATAEEGFEIIELPETKDVEGEVVEERPVGQAPTFMQPLQNVEAQEGQPIRFETTVTGIPQPEVSWFLDGEPIKESPVYHVITDASGTCILELPQSFPEDEGEYECRAVNEFGTASTKADLYIKGQLPLFFSFFAHSTLFQPNPIQSPNPTHLHTQSVSPYFCLACFTSLPLFATLLFCNSNKMLLQQLTMNVPSCESEVQMSLKSLFLPELDGEHNKM